jgi:hypothetical protein
MPVILFGNVTINQILINRMLNAQYVSTGIRGSSYGYMSGTIP